MSRSFRRMGNGPGEMENEGAQHFFGIDAAGLQTRKDFWNEIGDAGAPAFIWPATFTSKRSPSSPMTMGNTIIQLTAGNGGAPPQDFIDNPEPGVNHVMEQREYFSQ